MTKKAIIDKENMMKIFGENNSAETYLAAVILLIALGLGWADMFGPEYILTNQYVIIIALIPLAIGIGLAIYKTPLLDPNSGCLFFGTSILNLLLRPYPELSRPIGLMLAGMAFVGTYKVWRYYWDSKT